MLNIDSRLNVSLRKQKQYEKQTIEAESVLGSQFGEAVYRRIIELKKSPIHQRKLRLRTEEDSKRILTWAVAQRVREARERQGLTQEALAEKTGIARPNVVRLERGRHLPTISTLQKVARALSLGINSLMAQPMVTKKDRLGFTEMAEIGLDEWAKQLEDEDTKD
jgi:transcriptional regulator with XRE-family HTH domain